MALQILRSLDATLRFYSRLRLSGDDRHAPPNFATAAWAVPIAGAIIGGCGAATLIASRWLGLPALSAATVSVATLVLATGALHEDGLADVADGFGGGATRERKLEIMRDSRIGSYGATALALALLLRVSSLAALTERSLVIAACALLAAGAFSRAAALIPMVILTPARPDGAGASAQRPTAGALRDALIAAGLVCVAPISVGAPLASVATGFALALGAALFATKLAQRQIGGFTGDVLGAAQQAAECAVLLALAATRSAFG